MAQAVHLIAKNVAGYGLPEGRFLPHSRTSGTAVTSFSSHGECRTYSQVMMGSMKGGPFIATSISCKASSGRQRRNAEFSRQNKQGFSRNRQNEVRQNFENHDEYDLLSSKNGPLLSLSNPQKFQATAVPGPKEKEIVELFRKVQTQLRERAAAKEDNKVQATQGKGKQSETVDSLLKLLRKHSIEQGKKKTSQASSQDNDLEQNVPYADDKSKTFGDPNPNDRARNDVLDPNSFSPTRPRSNFQRKSPIPQVKMHPVYVTDDPVNRMSQLKLNGDKKQQFERLPDPADLDKSEQVEYPELKMEPGSSFVDDNLFDELSENESSEDDNVKEDSGEESLNELEDFSSLKLSELRTLAKSRAIKGFSKMKKADLVELLNGSSI